MTAVETPDRVAVPCPACSPDRDAEHEVLAEGGGYATVQCRDCHHVHKTRVPGAEPVERDVVISQDGESVTTTVEAPRAETLERGEEFVVETREAIFEVRITDLQVDAETRRNRASVEDVETIWTRAVDNVAVPTTINPADGELDESHSVKVHVPGDYEFTVGDREEHGDAAFVVTGINLRDDATGYGFGSLDHDGDTAVAKDIARVYGRDDTPGGWTAWW
ncbi:MAG: HVO_0476 family zinc finger protein [Halobacteriaceae archaeon]